MKRKNERKTNYYYHFCVELDIWVLKLIISLCSLKPGNLWLLCFIIWEYTESWAPACNYAEPIQKPNDSNRFEILRHFLREDFTFFSQKNKKHSNQTFQQLFNEFHSNVFRLFVFSRSFGIDLANWISY